MARSRAARTALLAGLLLLLAPGAGCTRLPSTSADPPAAPPFTTYLLPAGVVSQAEPATVTVAEIVSASETKKEGELRRRLADEDALVEVGTEDAFHAVRPELVPELIPASMREALASRDEARETFAALDDPEALRASFARFPFAAKPWRRLGGLFFERGQIADAIAAFEESDEPGARVALEAARKLELPSARVELTPESVWAVSTSGEILWERRLETVVPCRAVEAARVAVRLPGLALAEVVADCKLSLVGVDEGGGPAWVLEPSVPLPRLTLARDALRSEYAATPGRIFVAHCLFEVLGGGLRDRGSGCVVSAIEARTGRLLWSRRLPVAGFYPDELELSAGSSVCVSFGGGVRCELDPRTGRVLAP